MPFQCPRCVIDTNVLSDFHECGCLALIWQLFPGGVWIDPYVCEELKSKYQLDVQHALALFQTFLDLGLTMKPSIRDALLDKFS